LVIRNGPVEFWRLKYLLNRCSNKLEELTLNTIVEGKEDGKVEEEHKEEEVLNTGAQPKCLRLNLYGDVLEPKAFWLWLWRHCIYVIRLQVQYVGDFAQRLAEGMLTHIFNLDRIELGSETFSYKDENGYYVSDEKLRDDQVAILLSSCRKEWKAVQVRSSASFGESSSASLANHFSTLEELVILGGVSLGRDDLRRVLASYPNLRALVTIDNGTYYNIDIMCVELYAKSFVDLDHETGALNTWACEKSLKVLKVLITHVCDFSDPYSASQSQVYKRLARFINLETLWLGHDPRIETELHPDYSVERQDDCLQMSLESGLDTLQGLTALQELNVSNMDTLIGIKELQWMTQ
ncbi:hypothetical protein BGZ79_001179, partial [Entomortierella chlamydospora]